MFTNQRYSPDIHLADPTQEPTDTISKISWSTSSTPLPSFATSSWDSHIRIYQVNPEDKTMTQKACFNAESPCLCVSWHEDMTKVFTGCTSNLIKEFDLESGKCYEIGQHTAPVKDVYWLPTTKTLCSVSFDKTIKFWDLRQAKHVTEIRLEYKPYCSDIFEENLALGLDESKVVFMNAADASNLGQEYPLKYLNSNLDSKGGYPSIKFLADGKGFGLCGSTGKCLLAKLTGEEPIQEKKLEAIMSFKGHKDDRSPNCQQQLVYKINCLLINKKSLGFLGTCGGDGKVTFWDFQKKNKIRDLKMGVSTTAGEINVDGNLFAFATGEDWSRGISGYMSKRSQVFVHIMKDNEIKYTMH